MRRGGLKSRGVRRRQWEAESRAWGRSPVDRRAESSGRTFSLRHPGASTLRPRRSRTLSAPHRRVAARGRTGRGVGFGAPASRPKRSPSRPADKGPPCRCASKRSAPIHVARIRHIGPYAGSRLVLRTAVQVGRRASACDDRPRTHAVIRRSGKNGGGRQAANSDACVELRTGRGAAAGHRAGSQWAAGATPVLPADGSVRGNCGGVRPAVRRVAAGEAASRAGRPAAHGALPALAGGQAAREAGEGSLRAVARTGGGVTAPGRLHGRRCRPKTGRARGAFRPRFSESTSRGTCP